MTREPCDISPADVKDVLSAAQEWIAEFSEGKDLDDPTNIESRPTVDDLHISYLEVSGIPEDKIDWFKLRVEDRTGLRLSRPTAQDVGMTSWSFLFLANEEAEE